jgi:TM2 domain-containing membrane protein YozV
MKRNAFIASVLSLLIPGLGQIYIRKAERGALILIAVIIAGNLNAIWLSTFAVSSTITTNFFSTTLPRLLHDIFAFYGIVFWIWQVVDAYVLAKKE